VNENTLYELLDGLEWKDIELKESRIKVPDSAYESVSAFLNTEGGHIVLGVDDDRNIVGLLDADKIQGDFIGELHNPMRFGAAIECNEYHRHHDGKDVLIFYINEAQRRDKPVYVKTKKGRHAYFRKGGGDYVCNKIELDRLIRDAAQERLDSQLMDYDPSSCFDDSSTKWFRHRYENQRDNPSLAHLDDIEFLAELGLVAETKDGYLPTFASLMLIGKTSILRQIMLRPIVDCFHYSFDFDHSDTERRWIKRTNCEFNIAKTWQAVTDWYNSFSDNPFSLEEGTGQRKGGSPDFNSFREAVINLLSHQDFGDQQRWPTIENFQDRTRFWNPGDAFADVDKLLEPGAKEIRNPLIARALRNAGFSEQQGWGLRKVYSHWNALGRVPPVIKNDRVGKAFELQLLQKELMSEEQVLFQAQIGIRLEPKEAEALANICLADDARITHSALRAALSLTGAEIRKIVNKLIVQGVAIAVNDHTLALAEHLIPLKNQILSGNHGNDVEEGEQGDLSTEQVEPNTTDLSTEQVEPLTELTDKQRALLSYCDVPRSMAEMLQHVGSGSRGFLKDNHLAPLLGHGLMAMTIPDKPTSSKQKYVVTEQGLALKEAMQQKSDQAGE